MNVVGLNLSAVFWMDMTFFHIDCVKNCIVCLNKARTGPMSAARFCKILKLCNKLISIHYLRNTSTWGTQVLVIIV